MDVSVAKLAAIPAQYRKNSEAGNGGVDVELTGGQKMILIEAVKNALATPYAMTQSQYTDAS